MTKYYLESKDSLKNLLSQSSVEQFQEHLNQLPSKEIIDCLILLQTESFSKNKEKLKKLFEWLKIKGNLKTLGEAFSPYAFTLFLDILNEHPKYQEILTHLLTGLQPSVFSQSLPMLKKNHLLLLKHDGLHEPLQYHLIQFVHEGEALKKEIDNESLKFTQELSTLMIELLTIQSIQSLFDQIHFYRNQCLSYLEKADIALALVWNTNRIDLIEKLSTINETIQHQLTQWIGYPANDTPSTGLYAVLENRLSSIFDSSLTNDDAALEGMTRLGIWHLKDYWELGLFPGLKEFGTLNKEEKNKQKSADEKLMPLATLQLQKIGISTIADLKRFRLFSKPLLKAYIDENKHLL